jgi:hypothetical protein
MLLRTLTLKLGWYEPRVNRLQYLFAAAAQQQTILFIDKSAFYPIPSVVHTYAPMGQTPVLREWWTRDHIVAIRAISPEGKQSFQGQDHTIDSGGNIPILRSSTEKRAAHVCNSPLGHYRKSLSSFMNRWARLTSVGKLAI